MPPPPPPPPGAPPPPGPPPPPANGPKMSPPSSQPGRKALLASIENKPRLKKVDSSQINDRSAPAVAGSSSGGGGGLKAASFSGAGRQPPVAIPPGMQSSGVRQTPSGPKCPPPQPPTGSRAGAPPPPMPKANRSRSVDFGVGPSASQNLMSGRSPVPVPPTHNGFHLPSPAPDAGFTSTFSAGRRNTAVDFKTLPPTPTHGNFAKTGKTPPPPPVAKPAPAQQHSTSKPHIPVNVAAFPRSTSSPSMQPPPSSTLPRTQRPLPETPASKFNGHVSSAFENASRPQFGLPAPAQPRATAGLSPGFPPLPPSTSRFQVPSSPRAPAVGAPLPPVPPPMQRMSPAPRPSQPPGPPVAQQQFAPRVQTGASRGPPPALPPPRNPRPSSAGAASPALPPSRLPTGPPPPIPPPRMASRYR